MTDHIPLPPPDHTEDVPGFVHDSQRHYYSEETLRAYAERLHATRANGPAIMQAIGLLAVLQSWIGPRRPQDSEPEEQALWDQINATRIALMPLAHAGAPNTQAAPMESVLIDGVAYQTPAPVAAELLRLHIDARQAAPQQEAQEPVDSMGMPLSCGKPLCAPGEHHPLCKLAPPPAPQPDVQRGKPIMRSNPIHGLGMNPHKNGLYVRHEDHATAIAAAPAAQGDAEDAASWRALAQPTEETIIEAVEASCAHRPSVDDDSYVLRILRVFTNAARSQAKEGGAA